MIGVSGRDIVALFVAVGVIGWGVIEGVLCLVRWLSEHLAWMS